MILKNGKRIDGCSDTVPVGTLNPFLGLTPPAGYLICQGQLVSKQLYPELYTICGNIQINIGKPFINSNLYRGENEFVDRNAREPAVTVNHFKGDDAQRTTATVRSLDSFGTKNI